MTPHPEINTRMPYMRFNWATHSARCARLSLEERGVFDVVRCELWSVVGCRLPLDLLKTRLRITSASRQGKTLDALLSLGLLRQDSDGQIFDEVQDHEFGAAVAQAVTNAANGKKGGRPRKSHQDSLKVAEPAPQSSADADF